MPRVVFAARARAELRELGKRIAIDNPTAAVSFVAEIKRRCQLQAGHPLAAEEFTTARSRSVRRLFVGNYVIYFRPMSEGIKVLCIWHAARGEEPRF
jgi:toxin ParE1/3/4